MRAKTRIALRNSVEGKKTHVTRVYLEIRVKESI